MKLTRAKSNINIEWSSTISRVMHFILTRLDPNESVKNLKKKKIQTTHTKSKNLKVKYYYINN